MKFDPNSPTQTGTNETAVLGRISLYSTPWTFPELFDENPRNILRLEKCSVVHYL